MNENQLVNIIAERAQQSLNIRKDIALQIDSLCSDVFDFIKQYGEQFNNCHKEEIKYSMLHLGNVAELSSQIALLQQNSKNVGMILLARSAIEECSLIFYLINECNKSSMEVSKFYKYLVYKDMLQDRDIINNWGDADILYYNRFCNNLNKYFSEEISYFNVPQYSESNTSFTEEEIDIINKAINYLFKKIGKDYSATKIVKQMLNDIDTIDDDKNSRDIIYPSLCHYTHFNISAIDELCICSINETNYISFNNNCDELIPAMRAVYVSFQYIFSRFKEFVIDYFNG